MLAIHFYVYAFLISLPTIYVLHRVFQNYLTLRSIHLPGPLCAKLTSKWLLSKYITGECMNTVHYLHLKYGPVVQTGPNELSFATATARETIYGSNTQSLKSKVYDTFGPPSLFMFRDKEQHRERKRRVQHVFAPAVLREVEPMIQAQISKLLKTFRQNQRVPLDVIKPTHMLTLDIGGEVLLGKEFGAQDSLEGKGTPYFIRVMPYVHPMFALNREVPWLVNILEMLPLNWARDVTGSVDYVYGYGQQRLNESIEKFGRHGRRRDLLAKLIAGDPDKDTLPLPDRDIGYEVGNFIYAATDSTAIVMSYILYELASHMEWQDNIRRELTEAKINDEGYAYQSLQSLPVLQACVHESMRLHPGIGPGLPRVTPPEGMEIDSIWIPGNTAVSVPMHTLQRSPNIFPEPNFFNPARWLTISECLESDSERPSLCIDSLSVPLDSSPNTNTSRKQVFMSTPEQSAHWFLWGGGEYTCLGQHMAIMEIKILIARVIGEFEVSVREEDKSDWNMCDHFVVATKSGKGRLIFKQIHD